MPVTGPRIAPKHAWGRGVKPDRGQPPREQPAPPWIVWGAWLTLGGAVAAVLARGGQHDWATGDTRAMVNGLSAINRCLSMHVLSDCNAHLLQGKVSEFPLLQTIPAYFLRALGLSATSTISALAWLNAVVTVAFCAVVVRWTYRCGSIPLAVVAGLLLVPGMLIPYTAQTFGEPLAAVAFGGVALAALCSDRVSPWLVPLAFAATISKDTAFPFVLIFGLAGFALSGSKMRTAARSGSALAIGAGAGLACMLAFNIFRYGALTNTSYLALPTSSPGMAVNNILGLLLSPNGGITWFWPGTTIALLVLGVAVARGSSGGLDPLRVRVAAGLGLAAFTGSIVGLAFWWQPYGWYAWGPRLVMPIAAAVIVLALATMHRREIPWFWLSRTGAVALALMGVLVIPASIGVVFNPRAYNTQTSSVQKTHPECVSRPHVALAQITLRGAEPSTAQRLDHDHFERCLRLAAWTIDEMPLVKAVPSTLRGHWWYWITVLVASSSAALWASISRRSRQELATD